MTYFKLYANVVPVKGAKRFIICDLQRQNYHYIPEEMYELLIHYSDKTIEELKTIYISYEDDIIDEYVKFLIDKEYGFITAEPENFPSIDLKFELPERINNAIVDVNWDSDHDFYDIFNQLDDLDCKNLEIRFYDIVTFDSLAKILKSTTGKRFKNISVYLKFYPDIAKGIEQFFFANSFGNIGIIFVHSADETKYETVSLTDICYSKHIISSADCCGIISKKYFNINLPTYLEGLHYNTCLNKKIGIDVHGNIKNCPSMVKSFGDIKSMPLGSVIENEVFKKPWGITKDQIEICKDCQFRYICTDCRAFVSDNYQKPYKCSYDPYLDIWN
ncbi:grasp-with-spasm system SPASM domain peptide maturase [Mucilaginibacter sp. UYCu711]|uniref:grasp-with-spasm system SPASM domain peptide maturase n=1 Tax=Mucilaginibacter sp. UYCu711 TaxID=3156339 RepID=UPI003D1A08CB